MEAGVVAGGLALAGEKDIPAFAEAVTAQLARAEKKAFEALQK